MKKLNHVPSEGQMEEIKMKYALIAYCAGYRAAEEEPFIHIINNYEKACTLFRSLVEECFWEKNRTGNVDYTNSYLAEDSAQIEWSNPNDVQSSYFIFKIVKIEEDNKEIRGSINLNHISLVPVSSEECEREEALEECQSTEPVNTPGGRLVSESNGFGIGTYCLSDNGEKRLLSYVEYREDEEDFVTEVYCEGFEEPRYIICSKTGRDLL